MAVQSDAETGGVEVMEIQRPELPPWGMKTKESLGGGVRSEWKGTEKQGGKNECESSRRVSLDLSRVERAPGDQAKSEHPLSATRRHL